MEGPLQSEFVSSPFSRNSSIEEFEDQPSNFSNIYESTTFPSHLLEYNDIKISYFLKRLSMMEGTITGVINNCFSNMQEMELMKVACL